ncbi:DMT family transporter [Sporolactobacillus sp. THM7-4]|nr:DMT family transporter [Sporolactobacillus sp. THM7-4]
MKQSFIGALCLTLAASIWGGMYVVSKYVLGYISPLALVWIRYILAVALLFTVILVLRIKGRKPDRITKRDWILLIWIGFIGYFVSIVSQFMGTKLSDAHTGALITSTTPAFVVVFARLVLKEPMTARKIISLVLSTGGVVITIGLPDHFGSYFKGSLILVLAAVTWALLSVYVKKASASLSSLTITAYATLFALFFTTPFMVHDWNAGSVHLGSPAILSGVLYLGIVSTAGAFFLWNKGLEMMDTGIGSLFLFFQPVVGTLFGWLLLGEQLTARFGIGSVLILVGVSIASLEKTGLSRQEGQVAHPVK